MPTSPDEIRDCIAITAIGIRTWLDGRTGSQALRSPNMSAGQSPLAKPILCLCRLVRTNITENQDPSEWQVILPEHAKDILTGSTALKVILPALLHFLTC